MKITREINGETVEIELSPQEILDAHNEYELELLNMKMNRDMREGQSILDSLFM
jgi:hypothetical protein